MPRAAVAVMAALGLWAPLAASQDWFDIPEEKDPLGDLEDDRREALQRIDPGVQGSENAVGSAHTDEGGMMRRHGAELPKGLTFVRTPEEYSLYAGVKVLNATPITSYGATVVRTDHGLMPTPLWFSQVAWKLEDRPRRPALIVMEMQEDYRPHFGYMIPAISSLAREFRAQKLPVITTTWVRRPNDGLYGATDRAAGVRGLKARVNANYIYTPGGAHPMKELMPTPEEIEEGQFMKTTHANKFSDLDASGRSIMSDKIRELGVDTLVITGGWTDVCVLATVLDAIDSRNLDVVVVSDAVTTTDPSQQMMLQTLGNLGVVTNSSSLLDYLEAHKGDPAYFLEPVQRTLPKTLRSSTPARLDLETAVPATLATIGAAALLLCTAAAGFVLGRRSKSGGQATASRQPILDTSV